jgi:hypothetical protein
MTPETTIETALQELGFTRTEAALYVYLLKDSPATGYRIAKALGRSFAVTYGALDSLQTKGAILVDAGKSRLSRAVSPHELLEQRARRFSEQRDKVLEAAEQLPSKSSDARIYQITAEDQLYERARTMLAAAEERVLTELFPEPLSVLQEDLQVTAERGVDVTARVYERTEIPGVRVICSPFGSHTMESFRSQWFGIFVDGRQLLLAQLRSGGGGVFYAAWTANLILARASYAHMNSDLHHYAFRQRLFEATSLEEAVSAYIELEEVFPPGGDLGFQELVDLYSEEKEVKS